MIIKLQPSGKKYDVTINRQLGSYEALNTSVDEYIEVLDINLLLKIIKAVLVSFKPGHKLKLHKQAEQAQELCKEHTIVPVQLVEYLVDRVYYDKVKSRVTNFDIHYFVSSYLDTIGVETFSASVKSNNVSKFDIDDIFSLVAVSNPDYQYINLEDLASINLVLDDNTNKSE